MIGVGRVRFPITSRQDHLLHAIGVDSLVDIVGRLVCIMRGVNNAHGRYKVTCS